MRGLLCWRCQASGVSVSLTQDWFWYNSSVTNNNWGHHSDGTWGDDQNSGAYVRTRADTVAHL